MKIEEILKEFVKECSKRLSLISIIQFGSSTYLKNPNDIDLIFVSKNQIISVKDVLKLLKIIKHFENRNREIVFDIGGRPRKRKGGYKITVVLVGKIWLNIRYHPEDLFFIKNLSEDKNKKILFGENVFNKKVFMSSQHLSEMLHVAFTHAFGQSLDDKQKRNNAFYFLFKVYLRAMLINDHGVLEKGKLLVNFKHKFKNKIKLPKNSAKILEKKISDKDFIEILTFAKNCLKYLNKEK